ncbi:MAG: DNA-processing protein DprA [Dehalococcoidia bacterium]
MHASGLPYWLALRRAGLGSTNFSLLLARFGTIDDAWAATTEQVASAGLDAQYVRAFQKARTTFDETREMTWLEANGVRVYTWLDKDYPALLRDIPQSPPVLFVRGAKGPEFERAIAVVGTRRVTPYGRQATELFCTAVASAGVAIVSGLARGVDAIAHRVAIENGAPTVAVLAGGIDQVYPRENAGLAERILADGSLVSEYPVGIPARPDYFPRRNRILSGLAKATLVVEAGEGSGALHTANWAFEQGRDVFAIPGSIFSRQSQGTNQLIRESTARLVVTPEQLLEELNLATAARQIPLQPGTPRPAATQDEGQLLHWLQDGAKHVDEVVRASGLGIAHVTATLQVMELKGLVQQERPMVYART